MKAEDRYKIAFKALKDGVYDYEFVVDKTLFEMFDSSEIKDGKCLATISLKRGETMLELHTKIQGEVVVECDRCLDDCEVPVDYSGELVVKFSDEVNDYDGEIWWISAAETELDLSQYIYESIILSLPYQRVHEEGACNPEMMERVRIISGEEFDEMEQENESDADQTHGLESGDMAKLKALKEQMEKN